MRIEITSLASLRAHRAADQDLRGALLTGLDLTDPEDDRLLRTALDGAVLLGCMVGSATARRAEAAGALLFPVIPELPYQVYRTALYTPEELFAGFDPDKPRSYEDTVDARIYVHSKEQGPRPDPLHAIAERLHDHAITEALTDVLASTAGTPIAVMGGHALPRDSAGYRAAVDLGTAIGRSPAGFTVLTGGGPGAMEAVPLGVRLAGQPTSTVDSAVDTLATAPRFATNHPTRSASCTRSTSPTRFARTACSPSPAAGWCTRRAAPAPCRRSSRTTPRTVVFQLHRLSLVTTAGVRQRSRSVKALTVCW